MKVTSYCTGTVHVSFDKGWHREQLADQERVRVLYRYTLLHKLYLYLTAQVERNVVTLYGQVTELVQYKYSVVAAAYSVLAAKTKMPRVLRVWHLTASDDISHYYHQGALGGRRLGVVRLWLSMGCSRGADCLMLSLQHVMYTAHVETLLVPMGTKIRFFLFFLVMIGTHGRWKTKLKNKMYNTN